MFNRVVFVVFLLFPLPATAQEEQELEVSAAWRAWTPESDFVQFPSGPSATFSRVSWVNERRGYAIGVTSVLAKTKPRSEVLLLERAYPFFFHVGHRWRWSGRFHFGINAGAMLYRKIEAERRPDDSFERVTTWRLTPIYNVELFAQTGGADNGSPKVFMGARMLPFPPLYIEPAVMVTWGR